MLTLLVLLGGIRPGIAAATWPDDPGWPRIMKKDGKELTVYQPQVDSWQNYKNVHARFALAIKEANSKKETFGVAEVDAETVVDQSARLVTILPKNRVLRFPNTTDIEADALRRTVEMLNPQQQSLTVSLDRLLAYLDPQHQQLQSSVELNLDPPKILYSNRPAILVMIMGEPQLKAVIPDKNDLMFVTNTNWDVFYETASQRYFLLLQDYWLTATDLINGPWMAASTLPPGLSSLPADENWADVRSNVPGKPVKDVPVVLISKGPTELILTQGEPTYGPIPGTKLMRITNSDAVVFLHGGEGSYYFLVAGRWFRSPSLEGPWSIASNDLPKDFSLIPDNDPAAFVKASVPGTVEAKDAVLLASVPRTTTMNVNAPPKVKVVYKGAPNFQTIPTTAVQYATNTASAVFLVNHAYYCCVGGVWYTSNAAVGPWSYCTNVPAVIYTIPPSHPTHNVTYVTVYESTPTTVIYAQTAGYSGEYVNSNGVLMFGAGMVVGALLHEAWDDYHYPPPYSYGWGARYYFGHGGYYPPPHAPYYGPYRGAGFATVYNPYTGNYARGGYVYGPGGSAAWGRTYNPATGVRGSEVQVNTPNGSMGRFNRYNPSTGTDVHGGYRTGANGAVAGVATNHGTGAVAWDTARGEGAVVKGRNGNVYAGKDGNVYRRDSNGDWSSNNGNGWQPVDKPQPKATPQTQSPKKAEPPQAKQTQMRRKATETQPDSSRVEQPARDEQFQANARELDQQAQARSRGNVLNENRQNFNRQMGMPFERDLGRRR